MKDLAALALVVLPLGMTIVEILAAGDTSPVREQRDTEIGVQAGSARKATAAPAAEESRTGARWPRPPHASGAPDEHAVPGKPA